MAVDVKAGEPTPTAGGGEPPPTWQEVGFFVVMGLAFAFFMTTVVGLAVVVAVTDSGDSAQTAGDAAETASGGEQVELIAEDFEYTPAELTTGQELDVVLDNQGGVFHNVEIEGVEGFLVEAQPGQVGEGSLSLDPGRYTFFCSVPGHRDLGMEGILTVG